MKKIFIIGSPRSGKSTLVQMISNKHRAEIIKGDCILTTVFDALLEQSKSRDEFGNFKYKIPVLTESEKVDILKDMINQVLSDTKYSKKLLILETSISNIELLRKKLGQDSYIYCLGNTNITAFELFRCIRINDTKYDWSSRIGDTSLKEFCKEYIEESKKLESIISNFTNAKFFDTSGNRKEKLSQILLDIETNIIN